MIVYVIDIDCVTIHESEGDPPVARHGNGVVTPEFTSQRMQTETRNIHITRNPALIEQCKDAH